MKVVYLSILLVCVTFILSSSLPLASCGFYTNPYLDLSSSGIPSNPYNNIKPLKNNDDDVKIKWDGPCPTCLMEETIRNFEQRIDKLDIEDDDQVEAFENEFADVLTYDPEYHQDAPKILTSRLTKKFSINNNINNNRPGQGNGHHQNQEPNEDGEYNGNPSPACHFCQAGNWNGTLRGATYNVRIPERWNGILVVYARGYTKDKPTGTPAMFGDQFTEDILLSQGYALAGSTLSAGGWAVKEGIKDLLALRLYLVLWGCIPRHTILFGVSMGSVIALKSIESFHFVYSGAIAGCALGAGTSRTFDLSLRYNLGYDAALSLNGTGGFLPSWGTIQSPRPDINFNAEVAPILMQQVLDEFNFGRFEFLRLMSKLALSGFYDGPAFLFQDFFFSTEALAELNQRAGGPVTQNVGSSYTLTEEEKAYLRTLFINPDIYLDYMNSGGRNNIAANTTARCYTKLYADFNGRIKGPVITLHNQNDGLVPAASESAYLQTVTDAGRQKLLYQAYVARDGHCAFLPSDVVTTINNMASWLRRWKRPTPDKFPVSAGFLPADWTPGPWPY